ncbi:MAG: carbon storage regulator [Planctomycetales bacterium]|nr:carbon storage regulator [Planctomycetales bacterium]
MLVLSRKVGEKLVIGEKITVEVVRIKGNRITLGISAPLEVSILRSELPQWPKDHSKVEMAVEENSLVAC